MSKKSKFLHPLLISACALTMFGCAAMEEEEEQAPNIGQAPGMSTAGNAGSDWQQNQYQNQASNNPQDGFIRIKRHGPGFEMDMSVNANDDNIAFLMDLPQQKQTDKLKKDIYTSVKMLMDAQSLFYREDYNKALDTIDTSIELAPDNPHAHALRGSILYKLQKTQDAVYAWQKALEIEPTLTDVITTLKKLGIKE